MVINRGNDTMSANGSGEILSLYSSSGSTTWEFVALVDRREGSNI